MSAWCSLQQMSMRSKHIWESHLLAVVNKETKMSELWRAENDTDVVMEHVSKNATSIAEADK